MSEEEKAPPYPMTTNPPPPAPLYPSSGHLPQRDIQIVHDHDVLKGKGVTIAAHPGNERFRALVTSRYDPNYSTYSVSEKQAAAEEIVAHIKSLDPPGRFLKRPGRGRAHKVPKGLEGPWDELSHRECVKKAMQALRDCCRQDRTGYAAEVAVPEDVYQNIVQRSMSGLTPKEHAERAAIAAKREAEQQAAAARASKLLILAAHPSEGQVAMQPPTKRVRIEEHNFPSDGAVSPTVENAAEWLQKQKAGETSLLPSNTPTTAASTAGTLHDTSLLDNSYQFSSPHHTADYAEGDQTSSPNVAAFQYSPRLDESTEHDDDDMPTYDSFKSAMAHGEGNEFDSLHHAMADEATTTAAQLKDDHESSNHHHHHHEATHFAEDPFNDTASHHTLGEQHPFDD